jgi:hypothetical protein
MIDQSLLSPDPETKQNCLVRLKQVNKDLGVYTLFLEEAIAQVTIELQQQKCRKLSKSHLEF